MFSSYPVKFIHGEIINGVTSIANRLTLLLIVSISRADPLGLISCCAVSNGNLKTLHCENTFCARYLWMR